MALTKKRSKQKKNKLSHKKMNENKISSQALKKQMLQDSMIQVNVKIQVVGFKFIFIFKIMTTDNRYLFRWVVLVLLVTFHIPTNSQQSSPSDNQLTYNAIGDIIYGQNTDANQGKGFHAFKVTNLQKKYLFFDLMPRGQSSFLDIALYIYRGTQQTPFKACKQQEIDSCYMPQSQLQKNSQILVIVDCKQACTYDIKLYWSNIQHLNPGDKIKFMFAQEKNQLYHMELQKAGQFAQLRIILKPQTRRQMFDKVKIYGKYGTDSMPSADDYDFKSMHLWQDAEGIYLEKNQLRQKNLNLLIVGQSNTVYVLTCQIVNKTTHDIVPGEVLDQYLQPQQVATYHITFLQNNQLQHQEYTFKFSGFNGNLSLGFYTDPQFTKAYSQQPFQYMSDLQFTFTKQQIIASLPIGLYIKIKSFYRISTYVMEFTGRSKQSAIQLKENIYEMTEIQHMKPRVFYYDTYFFMDQEIYQEKYEFTVHMIDVKGKHTVSFRVCESDFEKCIDTKTFAEHSQLIQSKKYDEIGTKKTFRFQVPKDMLTNVNKVQQKLTVLLIVQNIQTSSSIVALQYYSQNKFQILRESRPIETRLKPHQTKLYKFTNVDKKIKQVRIHINKLSGIVSVISLRESPEMNSNNGKKEVANVVSFTEGLMDKPIYLILFAEQESIVSIDVQLIHENAENIASITMQEDVEFKIKIPPNGIQFLQIHPVYESIFFDWSSTGMALVCQYENNRCKKQIPDMGTHGSIQQPKFTGHSTLIFIQNPSDTKTIEFTSIYHSSNYEHCEHKQTGVLYSEIIQKDECFSFPVHKTEDVEVLISRMDIGGVYAQFLLCGTLVDVKAEGQVYKISKEVVEQKCEGKQHTVMLVIVSAKKPGTGPFGEQALKDKSTFKVKIITQYPSQGAVLIPDGIAYQTTKTATQSSLQTFYYEVLNKINTTIILTNKIGTAYFTAKLTKTVDRHKSLTSNTFDFSSNNTNYFLNPILTVPQQFFQSHSCKSQCSLVIKVYSKQKIGARNDFTLEVTQNYFKLQQHKQKSDFLTKDAFAYYSFFNKESNNSLLIQTSDNSQKCTKILVSDRQYPSQTNNLQVQYGNQLIIQNAQNKTYFIAIQALENCGYEISVSTTKTHITRLQRGKLGYLKLEQGQVKYFMFHRLQDNPFKLLSIHVYGQLEFYLNRTTNQQLEQLLKTPKIDYTKFTHKGQYKNRLLMDEGLCQNCYYILACLAKKNTDSSIYLGDDESFLAISQKKSINDQLKHKGDTLKGYYYDVQDTVMKVKVHSGKLGVKVSYYDQVFEKTFEKLDDLYQQQFSLKRKPDDWSPASVTLTAQSADTLYSIRFQSTKSTQFSTMVDQTQITPGQPNYIYMTSQKVYCLKGYWRDQKEILMITADELYEHGLQEMKIQVVVNGTELKFDKEIVRNIMSVKIPLVEGFKRQAQRYSVCLSSAQESFSATAFQTEDVNILPPDVETVAYGTRKYAIRPSGNFLIDVFECVGKANISYSESLKNLSSAKSSSLSILGMPDQPHAFKISEYLTTFVEVQTQMATVRWLPMDQKDETGLGYLHYKVGQLRYASSEDYLTIHWQGLTQKTQSHTKLTSVIYTVYITNDTDLLQSAQNCDYYIDLSKILKFTVNTTQPTSASHYEVKVQHLLQQQKSTLLQKYPTLQNLFISVVAQTDIQPIKGQLEHYRFFYPRQQIPKDVFVANSTVADKAMSIGVIVAGVLAFLVVTWVCTKKVFPMIARLKNRLLIEEEDNKQQQELGDVPPPSSERKTNIATQEKMNDEIQKQ